MRELPEPDIISEIKHFACPKCLSDLGYRSPIHIGYTRDQVLAIQKQAYEDGLRDAASLARSISDKYDFGYFEQGVDIVDELEEKILAMLTASQKEQK